MFKLEEILPGKMKKIAKFQHKGGKYLFILFVCLVLVGIAFVFLYPLAYMIVTSLKSAQDLVDPYVQWIPKHPTLMNLKDTWTAMRFLHSGINSSIIALASSFAQIISCSFVGYGLARGRFSGRDLLFLLVLFTFIIPPQTIIISLYILYARLGWTNTYYPFIIPSFFAQGLRGALFIYIFRQFFKGFPQELDDAGRIDGAGGFRIYSQIFLPLAKPAILVVFLFSFIWHWNDYYEPVIYLMDSDKFTLPIELTNLYMSLTEKYRGLIRLNWNEGKIMAGCLLAIVPPLILYAFTQKYFVSSIERTGLVE